MKFSKYLASLLIVTQLATVLQTVAAENRIELPDIGDPTGTLMTPLQEQQLGAAFFRKLHSQMEISQDPEVSDYIQSIGQKLAASSDSPGQSFHFFVVVEPTINAFAGPGGYIGVNTGLILVSEAESELASVLAHEISHVTQRHLYQTFQAAGRMALPTAVAMLAAILLGAKGNAQAGQAAIVAAQAANMQYQINFTRDNEAEADRVGMQLLSKSEFDPRAMPTFFERMQQSTRFAGHQLPEFLLTHPVTVSRISDTRGRAEQFPYKQYPDSLTYQIIRAKLRVRSESTPRTALEYFRAIADQGTRPQRDVAAYGLALALVKNSRTAEARPILTGLIERYPDQPHFLTALADIEMDAHNYPRAAELYQNGLKRFPANPALTLSHVRLSLITGKPEQARQLLQGYMGVHNSTPEVYELMAEIYSRLNREAASHQYLAEAYYAAGQTRDGIMHLRLAKKLAGNDYYLNFAIDQRLREFLAEEKERKER